MKRGAVLIGILNPYGNRDGRGQKPRQSFICNRYRCSGRVADWLGSLGHSSFLKDS